MSISKRIVFTGNLVYTAALKKAVSNAGLQPVEIEIMELNKISGPADLAGAVSEFAIENMVYSRAEHVSMFLELVDDTNESDLKKNVVHFVQDSKSFELLNNAGFPVLQSPGAQPIDMVEYFLRLNRTGPVLTPCVDPETEEIPEFLAELKYESRYLKMYEARPFSPDELEDRRLDFYRKMDDFGYVLLHEPGTITQFLVAFPDADPSKFTFVPLHKKSAARLDHLGLKHTGVISWHPDQPESFSEQLREAVT
ncbi:MAG: hypothetical protein LAT84_04235 [Balneolia bacterium]|nr:hypothetical protein [Balneolia bacterium]